MSVHETYTEVIMQNVIQDLVKQGTALTAGAVVDEFTSRIDGHKLSEPWFEASAISKNQIFSSSSFNNKLATIQQDLDVSFKHLLQQAANSNAAYLRWTKESNRLSAQLKDLQNRLDTLLLITKNTEGYLNYVYDALSDSKKIDTTNSTTYFDSKNGLVSIGTSSLSRVSLSNATIEFSLLSQNNLISIYEPQLSDIKNISSGKNSFWQKKIIMSQPTTVTTEILIKFTSSTSFSSIFADFHAANFRSLVSITPMYSTDGYNYSQLPVSNFTQDTLDKAKFQFNSISAKYVKILMTKAGYDYIDSNGGYVYEFGLNTLALRKQAYSTSSSNVFHSSALSITGKNKKLIQFSKLALEACEDLPTSTSIDYSIAVGSSSSITLSNRTYYPISPSGRTGKKYDSVIQPGNFNEVTVSGVAISHDASQTSTFISPAKSYSAISAFSGTSATINSITSSIQRYIFPVSTLKLLNHSLATDLNYSNLTIWRNVVERESGKKVRDTMQGWRQEGDWFLTSVYVSNKAGLSINFGGKPVFVDNTKRTGIVSFTQGSHLVSIHKDNFNSFTFSGISTLSGLKSADSLYPYNQRYLIEGLDYPSTWTEEKVYIGFDIVAEYVMKKVSVFDMSNNSKQYKHFATDRDLPDSGATVDGSSSSRSAQDVMLLHVDTSHSDFVNEKFTLQMKSLNQQYKYIWLKAVLSTQTSGVAPSIDSYRIKVAD